MDKKKSNIYENQQPDKGRIVGKRPGAKPGSAKIKAKRSNSGTAGDQNLRNMHTKVKTARGRKLSSTLWLQWQLNDPYVKLAKAEGYASRAAYKLAEIDDRYKLLNRLPVKGTLNHKASTFVSTTLTSGTSNGIQTFALC